MDFAEVDGAGGVVGWEEDAVDFEAGFFDGDGVEAVGSGVGGGIGEEVEEGGGGLGEEFVKDGVSAHGGVSGSTFDLIKQCAFFVELCELVPLCSASIPPAFGVSRSDQYPNLKLRSNDF